MVRGVRRCQGGDERKFTDCQSEVNLKSPVASAGNLAERESEAD